MNQDRQAPPGGESTQLPTLPEATVARLPEYLRALHSLADIGRDTVSSEDLAAAAGINAAKLRKDLSQLGSYGTRGVGYDVELLTSQISTVLGLAEHRAVALVGIGNLGHALAGYAGFGPRGFRIAALFDVDDSRLGETINGLLVRHVADIAEVVATEGISIAMLTTPPHAAQPVADLLVNAGVTSILNFAPCVLSVPDGVDVRKVDLAIELQILSFHEHRKASARTASSQPPPAKPVPAKKTAKKTATAKIADPKTPFPKTPQTPATQSPPKNAVSPPPGVTFSDSVVNE